MDIDPSKLLPTLTSNKKYAQKKKYLNRKRRAELEREKTFTERLTGGKKRAKKARKDASSIKKKKVRRPTTTVSGAKTGKETLVKKKAKKLVEKYKAKKNKASALKAKKNRPTSEKASLAKVKVTDGENKVKLSTSVASPQASGEDARKGSYPKRLSPLTEEAMSATPPEFQTSPLACTSDELDRALIDQAIRGKDFMMYAGAQPHVRVSSFVQQDPTLYPSEVPFYKDFAQKKDEECTTEDALLDRAHRYFKELNMKERQIHQTAAAYLKKMRSINRRGGDKDGFRYVLPTSAKQLARQMMLAGSAAARNDKGGMPSLATLDSTALDSTFSGDGVRETEQKPVRSRRRRPSTFSDFYKFQVSKRWTQNAENFLNRGRAHKALFEAKKRQRSIRKL